MSDAHQSFAELIMSPACFRLNRASRVERNMIDALRVAARHATGVSPAGTADVVIEKFAARARALGYAIRPAGSAYVSPDEIKLIAWIALIQRGAIDHAADRELRAILEAAAAVIKGMQRLPRHAIERAGLAHCLSASDSGVGPCGEKISDPGLAGATQRARAVAFVRAHGRATTKALSAIGISRQYVRTLHLSGALVRVRHGIYAVPDRVRATPAT